MIYSRYYQNSNKLVLQLSNIRLWAPDFSFHMNNSSSPKFLLELQQLGGAKKSVNKVSTSNTCAELPSRVRIPWVPNFNAEAIMLP